SAGGLFERDEGKIKGAGLFRLGVPWLWSSTLSHVTLINLGIGKWQAAAGLIVSPSCALSHLSPFDFSLQLICKYFDLGLSAQYNLSQAALYYGPAIRTNLRSWLNMQFSVEEAVRS